MEPVYTVREVAAYLKVTTKTVYRMLEDSRLNGSRLGYTWRIRESDLIAFLDAHRRRSGGSERKHG